MRLPGVSTQATVGSLHLDLFLADFDTAKEKIGKDGLPAMVEDVLLGICQNSMWEIERPTAGDVDMMYWKLRSAAAKKG